MISEPAGKRSSCPTFTIANSLRKMLVKPRLGRRRCRGICPPSKPRMRRDPLRERCPLLPRVEVLPMPEPMPRPTRLRLAEEFFGALNVERFIVVSRFQPPGSKPD